MLNENTRKRLLSICEQVSKKKKVSDHDISWAQKLAIYDEEATKLLEKSGKFIPASEQEDTSEV